MYAIETQYLGHFHRENLVEFGIALAEEVFHLFCILLVGVPRTRTFMIDKQ